MSAGPESDATGATAPIACTLDDGEMRSRVDQWRRAFADIVTAVERPTRRRLLLAVGPDPDDLVTVVALARAEKACCAFFDFTLLIAADTVTLAVEVPAGAEDILDDFTRLGTDR